MEYTAENYSNAETVGHADGYSVFVPFVAVGERALVRITYVKGSVAYGEVVRLLQVSPHRVNAPCKYFGKCGGCSLMHLDYAEQLRFKRDKVAANLAKIGKIQAEVSPCIGSDKIVGYRNKLSLPVRGVRGNVRVGMYKRNSHQVIQTNGCLLGGDWANLLVSDFVRYCNSLGVAPYNERDFTGDVRHLVARFVDGQLLVTVVSNGKFGYDFAPFAELLSKHFDRFGLFVNINTLRNNVIVGDETQHVCGLEYIESEHLGVKFRLQPTSFFQVNDGVKNAIYTKARQLLDLAQTEVLVDCFSGIGVLTAVLASDRYDSYAIEIEPSATYDADQMAQLNGLTRITNICGDVTEQLPRVIAANRGKRLCVTVDPPRKGLGDKICRTLLDARPDAIVYISCDSATLARDLNMLQCDYDVTYIQPYDMFPQTDQVETVASLNRRQRD